MDTSIYFGTSGILLPYKNKSFYPEALREKSRLAVYSMLFDSLEVNSSFYKMPRENTVLRWSEETTAGFRFTFKLWKGITHTKALQFDPADVDRFINNIHVVGQKKACILIQLPPAIRFDSLPRLGALLEQMTAKGQSKGWHVGVEFRHPSWKRDETYKLLDSFGAAQVLHDKQGGELLFDAARMPFVYLRFHGPEGDYGGSYDDAFLYEYSHYIRDWFAAGKEIFVYFNNTMGNALANLNTLRSYVES